MCVSCVIKAPATRDLTGLGAATRESGRIIGRARKEKEKIKEDDEGGSDQDKTPVMDAHVDSSSSPSLYSPILLFTSRPCPPHENNEKERTRTYSEKVVIAVNGLFFEWFRPRSNRKKMSNWLTLSSSRKKKNKIHKTIWRNFQSTVVWATSKNVTQFSSPGCGEKSGSKGRNESLNCLFCTRQRILIIDDDSSPMTSVDHVSDSVRCGSTGAVLPKFCFPHILYTNAI